MPFPSKYDTRLQRHVLPATLRPIFGISLLFLVATAGVSGAVLGLDKLLGPVSGPHVTDLSKKDSFSVQECFALVAGMTVDPRPLTTIRPLTTNSASGNIVIGAEASKKMNEPISQPSYKPAPK